MRFGGMDGFVWDEEEEVEDVKRNKVLEKEVVVVGVWKWECVVMRMGN